VTAPQPGDLSLEAQAIAGRKLVRALADRLAASDREIVAGPWIAEVGFEVLYWIPFLRWLVENRGVEPSRLTAVSRGGVSSWYEGVCGRYVELFDAVEVEEFHAHTEDLWLDSGGRKQVGVTAWDEALLDRALGPSWREWELLHPSVLRDLFRPWWRGVVPIGHVQEHAVFRRWEPPRDESLEALLPDEYAAVRFYYRSSFPDTPENRALAADVVRRLGQTMPVVLLNTQLEIDDHADFAAAIAGALRPLEGVSAATNLRAQSVVISGARVFVGTYGGLSYVAPLYGRPSIAFWSDAREWKPSHLELANHAFDQTGAALTLLDSDTFSILDAVAGAR
jgi:hypothetical protein